MPEPKGEEKDRTNELFYCFGLCPAPLPGERIMTA